MLFVQVLNLKQLDDPGSSDGAAPKSAQIDFGDSGMFFGIL
jgi:hypothetical protein